MRSFIHSEDIGYQPAPGQKVINADDYLTYKESNSILNMARNQAEKMADKARKAYEIQEEYGYQDGMDRAKDDLLQEYIKSTEQAINFISSFEKDAVNIVMSAVERIIGDFDDSEKVRRVVSKLVEPVKDQQDLTLKVNAESLSLVQSALAGYAKEPAIKIVADADLEKDSFVLETVNGVIDGSIHTQLKFLEQALSKSITA